MYSNSMLSGMRIYTSDNVWRQILCDLGADVTDAATSTDINLDDLDVPKGVSSMQLKKILLDASDDRHIIKKIFSRYVKITRLQAIIVISLYKSGGMTADQLKIAAGYAPDTTTHTVDTAIYQLRRAYGRQFIENNNGVYKLGQL